VDPHLAELLREVDPAVLGRRIRTARLDRGLTQAQVADARASVGYMSRIEAGQRRPDGTLLAFMADQLSVSVEELLTGVSRDDLDGLRLALDYAELSLATGSASDALTSADDVIERAPEAGGQELVRQARFVRARALEASGDLESALIELEGLLERPERDLTWLKCAIAITRCYRETGELGRAVDSGEAALRILDRTELLGTDESVQLTVTLAAAYFERGDTNHAVRLCRKAITRAEELNSATARASAYWNASMMESEQGDVAAAVPLAKKALALLEEGDVGRNVARLRSTLGIFQLRLDPPELAEAQENLVQAGQELEWTSASPVDVARNELALGRALFLRGELDEALEQAAKTEAVAAESAPLLSAEAKVLRGQIAGARGDHEGAARSYREAILTLSSIGADRGAAQLWFELASLLEELGEVDEARDAYKRAAASTGLTARATLKSRV
jgi:tetratricopeptide (TPR) repeat protein